jgi:beta-glucosidase
VRVTATVTNTGRRSGTDVAQLYVGDPSSTGEPPRSLADFDRVTLAPGQSARVSFTVTPQQLSWWDQSANGWTQTPGQYDLYVGDSSALANLPLRGTFTVAATPGARQVAVTAPKTVAAGQPFTARVTLTAAGDQTLPAVRLALQVPPGWRQSASGPTVFGAVDPSQAVTATFTVTPPADSPAVSAVVHATATMGAAQRENGSTVTVSGA